MTNSSSLPPPPPVDPLVALGSGGGGSTVAGSVVEVGSGGGSVSDGGIGVTTAVSVGTGVVGTGVVGAVVGGTVVDGPPGGGTNVLRGVRMIGVSGTNGAGTVGVPEPVVGMSGQGWSVIGNSKQLASSMQTFRVKDAFWAPRQSRMRRPLTSWALRQVTPEPGSATLKNAWFDMISTACASSFTQN